MNDVQTSTLAELVLRPHHCGVCVEDFDAAVTFFRDIIGMTMENHADHRSEDNLGHVVGLPGAEVRWALFELHDFRIELFKHYGHPGRTLDVCQSDRGITHLAFEVSDTDEVYRRMRKAGYETFSEPLDLRGGATRPLYVRGPEGIVVEFLEIRR